MDPAVSIRLYEESDVEPMTVAARESMTEVSAWMPWCHEGYSVADAAAWVRATRAAHVSGEFYDFAILDPAGRYAGGCGINHINRTDGVANLGYWLRTSLVGRGIASAAVTRLISWTFANTSLHRLEIVVADGNVRSQRVAERVGAHRDAVLRKRLLLRGAPSDATLYSIIRPD